MQTTKSGGMNTSELYARAKSHTFEGRPIALHTTAELEALAARCSVYAQRLAQAGREGKPETILHCQIVDELLGGWPRWSLLRELRGLDTVLPGDTRIDEVHKICDAILAKGYDDENSRID